MASDSGTGRTSNTGGSTDIDNTKPKVEASPEKNILLPVEPDTHIKIESERISNTFPNIESIHHNIEQKMDSENEITRIRTNNGGNSEYVSVSKPDSFQQNKTSQYNDAEYSNNVRFEKSEGLKDKFHKFINEKFRRDYNGQKKKSRRNLK